MSQELNRNIQTKKRYSNGFSRKIVNFFDLNRKVIGLVMFFSIVSLGVLYLGQMNAVATKGFEIKNLEKELNRLEDEQKKLKLIIANKQSLGEIQQKIEATQMVKTSSIQYLSSQGSVVAAK